MVDGDRSTWKHLCRSMLPVQGYRGFFRSFYLKPWRRKRQEEFERKKRPPEERLSLPASHPNPLWRKKRKPHHL